MVGPDGPILDPDASAWRAHKRGGGEKKNEGQPLDRPRSFRGDPVRAVVPRCAYDSGSHVF